MGGCNALPGSFCRRLALTFLWGSFANPFQLLSRSSSNRRSAVMKKLLSVMVLAGFFAVMVVAADEVVSVLHGVVTKVDAAAKTIVVKAKDGAEHAIHFADKTVVKGGEAVGTGAKDTFEGVKEGSEVVAHYTVTGTEKTAVEVDKVAKGGYKVVEGTVTKVGEGGKTITVKAADGTEQTFEVAGRRTQVTAAETPKRTQQHAQMP